MKSYQFLAIFILTVLLLTACTPKVIEDSTIDPTQSEIPLNDIPSEQSLTEEERLGDPTDALPEESTNTHSTFPLIHTYVTDVSTTYGLTLMGEPVTDTDFTYMAYVEATSTVMASRGEDWYLINPEDLSLSEPLTYEALLEQIEAQLFQLNIRVFEDETSGYYGYRQDGHQLRKPKYTYGTSFKDGYAIIGTYDDTQLYHIIDKNFDIQFTSEFPLYNYGLGFFGLATDFSLGNPLFDRVHIIRLDGSYISNDLFFEVDVIDENTLLVGDHLGYRKMTAQGDYVPKDGYISSFNGTKKATVIGEQLLLEGYNIDGSVFYSLYDANNNLLDTSQEGAPSGTIHLGDAYDVERQLLLRERFRQVILPQLSNGTSQHPYTTINNRIVSDYGYALTPISTIEDVWSEEETTFNALRIGETVEINIHSYWYGFGAAHPNYFEASYHVDLATGEVYSLEDLFADAKSYQIWFTSAIQAKANVMSDAYFDVDQIEVNKMTQFHISETGLQIYYNIYEIAPYAAGIQTFDFTFEEVKDLLDQESPFYRSITRKETP